MVNIATKKIRDHIFNIRTLLWTTVRAQVYGFKGTINSYKQYKQDKPTYLEENFGYPPSEGTIKVEVKDD